MANHLRWLLAEIKNDGWQTKRPYQKGTKAEIRLAIFQKVGQKNQAVFQFPRTFEFDPTFVPDADFLFVGRYINKKSLAS